MANYSLKGRGFDGPHALPIASSMFQGKSGVYLMGR